MMLDNAIGKARKISRECLIQSIYNQGKTGIRLGANKVQEATTIVKKI